MYLKILCKKETAEIMSKLMNLLVKNEKKISAKYEKEFPKTRKYCGKKVHSITERWNFTKKAEISC
jgi:hypothetical protein